MRKQDTIQIPEGYHNSALGVIPINWKVEEFSDFAKISKGKYTPTINEDVKCLELEHIEQETGRITGWTSSFLQKSTKNKFEKNQVLFGKLRPYLRKYWLAEFEGVCSSEVWVLNVDERKGLNKFLFYLIQSNKFIQIANVSSGSKMPRADWHYVSSIPFVFPPLPEQQAISECLSTWDNAIKKQQALIEQKELRKKGFMQRLLSGKKRLKGFEEDWEEIELGEVIKEYKKKPTPDTVLPVFTSSKRGLLLQSEYYLNSRITQRENVDYNILPVDYLTYRSRSDDGIFTFNFNDQNVKGLISGYYPVFKFIKSDNTFMHCFINHYNNIFRRHAIGTSQLVLSINEFKRVKVKIPSLKEQTAIAEILITANKEIELEKQRLQQLKDQKKGLMQQLLTGKKRLKIN